MPAWARQRTSITVVLDDNYPPYIFRGSDGAVQGILKDRWEAWGRKTGIRVQLLAMDWARAQAVMNAGEADVIDTLFETPERLKLYDYSKPYATIDVPIFFHSSISGITGAETLRGFTVGVKDGDACIDWLDSRGIKSLRRYPSYESMIDAAGKHELRILCIDQPPASYFLYKMGLESQFRSSAPLYSGQFHWAVRKGDAELYRLIAKGFAAIPEEDVEAIQTKWMGSALTRPDSRYVEAITLALEVAALGALVLAAWAWLLRRQVASRTRQLEMAVDALKSSERHYRELVSLTPVGVFETDAAGHCIFVNDRWSKISGISAERALGDGWADGLHPDDRARIFAEWATAARDRVMFQSEYRFVAAGRRETWVLGQARAKQDPTGLIVGYIGTITDISAAKAAEAALAASEARFRTIFDNINDAIFIHDLDSGAILAVNQRMLEMYGYRDEAVVIHLNVGELSDGAPPYDDAAARYWIGKAAAGEPQMFEWRAKTSDGRLFWVEVNMRRSRIGGDNDRLLVVVRDISERKQVEQALTERTEALERSNADLEQFAYVASHDLREPLRMVSSYMALVERRYGDRLDKDGHEFISFAKEGAVRMDRLVQDLLEFSRVGRIKDPPVETSLDLVLANVLRVLRAVIADADAEVRCPMPLPKVVCCANEIFLLFQNMISNAVKFRAHGRPSVVTISAEQDGGLWRFAISDNGIGIEQIYFDRIFKIFHRLHTREHYDGTGIGLSICKKIVERHGGRIWVDSVHGEGTTFFFTLGATTES
ncbi:PAS domain S-box protein [Paramagnetospirillum kuznetsovii]|uniref:PAS domain S-box protein n=1 Tax=Paramagnetospirillum kuznetsovii TaxID=2053833 RepID=UPI001374AD5C|nr:PAS domain S-box protein [Paramagnetospirillum kuznetsovii]